MLTWLRGLLSGRSVPGWLVLWWVVLGEIHEGKFALEVFSGITDFFQHHIFIGLFIGFGLLFFASAWSDLKKRLPSWLSFSTIHERVHAIESQLKPPKRELPECFGVIYRKNGRWVTNIKSMRQETLSDATMRIDFLKDGCVDIEITNPNAIWTVIEQRGSDGDRTHERRDHSITLKYKDVQFFDFISIGQDGGLLATPTAALGAGDWEARMSLISAGQITLSGVVTFAVFPDNDIEWGNRKFQLRSNRHGAG
jgi:hypothetical protein